MPCEMSYTKLSEDSEAETGMDDPPRKISEMRRSKYDTKQKVIRVWQEFRENACCSLPLKKIAEQCGKWSWLKQFMNFKK